MAILTRKSHSWAAVAARFLSYVIPRKRYRYDLFCCFIFVITLAFVLHNFNKKRLIEVDILSLLHQDLDLNKVGFKYQKYYANIGNLLHSPDFVVVDGQKVIAVIIVRSPINPVNTDLIRYCKAHGISVLVLECIFRSNGLLKERDASFVSELRPGQGDNDGVAASIVIDSNT